MIHQVNASITAIRSVGPSLYRMSLHCPPIARKSAPGNFVHVLTSETGEPFWRRAYSVHDVDLATGTFRIVFKVVGRGTGRLSLMKEGETLNLLGPLGNNFTLPSKNEIAALVAGGVGTPPLHFLARVLIRKKRLSPGRIFFFVGMKRKAEHFCLPELLRMRIHLLPATDDGSLGFAGFVTSCFEEWVRLSSPPLQILRVYSCGPEEMLKEMAILSSKYHLRCEASLETVMPCGVGACMGCAVKVRGDENLQGLNYKRVCKEGPVFPLDRIIWGD